jgi:hypothetical protein
LEASENSLPNLLEDRASEESAAGQPARYIEMGCNNAKALKGRVTAWKEARGAIKQEKNEEEEKWEF